MQCIVKGTSKRGAIFAWFMSLLIAIVALIVGSFVGGRSYIVVSAIIICCALMPPIFGFERSRPDAMTLTQIALWCALAIASRAAFAPIPSFKPIAAMIMMASMSLGPAYGFMIGALSMLGSGFIFGIGLWTPWQMVAYGLCGAVFGFLGKGSFGQGKMTPKRIVAISILGALFVVFIVGPILDTNSLFYIFSAINLESVIAVYAAGFPFNLVQGLATLITLLLLLKPVDIMSERLKKKYG